MLQPARSPKSNHTHIQSRARTEAATAAPRQVFTSRGAVRRKFNDAFFVMAALNLRKKIPGTGASPHSEGLVSPYRVWDGRNSQLG